MRRCHEVIAQFGISRIHKSAFLRLFGALFDLHSATTVGRTTAQWSPLDAPDARPDLFLAIAKRPLFSDSSSTSSSCPPLLSSPLPYHLSPMVQTSQPPPPWLSNTLTPCEDQCLDSKIDPLSPRSEAGLSERHLFSHHIGLQFATPGMESSSGCGGLVVYGVHNVFCLPRQGPDTCPHQPPDPALSKPPVHLMPFTSAARLYEISR